MPGVSLREYRELVVRSGLMKSDAVQEQYSKFLSETGSSDNGSIDSNGLSDGLVDQDGPVTDPAIRFARNLENNGFLTSWQNANLLRGRYRGLMFGKFRILRLLGAGGMGAYSWQKTRCCSDAWH